MDKTIRLKIKKELDIQLEKKIIKLKGALITAAYTDIIHISDEGEEFYINSFQTLPEQKEEIISFITTYLNEQNLNDSMWIL